MDKQARALFLEVYKYEVNNDDMFDSKLLDMVMQQLCEYLATTDNVKERINLTNYAIKLHIIRILKYLKHRYLLNKHAELSEVEKEMTDEVVKAFDKLYRHIHAKYKKYVNL